MTDSKTGELIDGCYFIEDETTVQYFAILYSGKWYSELGYCLVGNVPKKILSKGKRWDIPKTFIVKEATIEQLGSF